MPTAFVLPKTRTQVSEMPWYVETEARVAQDGRMVAVTTYRSDSDLDGFKGGAQIFLIDAQGRPIAASNVEIHGVDGRIGDSVRQIQWEDQFDPAAVANAVNVGVAQTWNPSLLGEIVTDAALGFEAILKELLKEHSGGGGSGDPTSDDPSSPPWNQMQDFLKAEVHHPPHKEPGEEPPPPKGHNRN
jgi:hypothetical protein